MKLRKGGWETKQKMMRLVKVDETRQKCMRLSNKLGNSGWN